MKFKSSTVIFCVKVLLVASISATAYAENLRDIYQLARANDPRILAAEYEREASALDIPIARAARRPSLNLLLDQDYQFDSSIDDGQDEAQFEPGLLLNVPLYNRGTNMNVQIAKLSSAEAQVSFIQQEQSLFIRTAQLYFTSLRADDAVEIARSAIEAFESQVELATELAAERLISRSDVAEAKATLDSAKATLIDATTQSAAADEALKVAIGRYPRTLASIRNDVTLDEPEPNDAEQWVAMGLENNPTLRLTKLQTETADARVELSRSGHFPTLDLQAFYTATRSNRDSSDGVENREISLRFNLPLYQGGAVQARTAQARLRKELTQQQLSFAQRAIEEQIRNSFANVNASIGRAEALEQAVRSNEASLEGIRLGVEVQTRTIVDLLDATNRLASARVELSGVRYDYLFNLLALKSFSGELEPADLSSIDLWLK